MYRVWTKPMNIIVNDSVVDIARDSSIAALLKILDKPLHGSAIAVNQSIVSRCQWAEYRLAEGDKISLFQAIAGG